MDIKEFMDLKSKKLNVIDNTLGVLAGIGVYHFVKAQTTSNWRTNNEYGAVALTGLSVLQVAAGVEAANFVRERSRNLRLSLTGFQIDEDFSVNGIEDYQTILVPSEEIANNVIERAEEIFSEKGSLNVSELYDICGLSSSARDLGIGWDDISNFRITKTEDNKWLIDVPKAKKF